LRPGGFKLWVNWIGLVHSPPTGCKHTVAASAAITAAAVGSRLLASSRGTALRTAVV
jgi:hypothetical protein